MTVNAGIRWLRKAARHVITDLEAIRRHSVTIPICCPHPYRAESTCRFAMSPLHHRYSCGNITYDVSQSGRVDFPSHSVGTSSVPSSLLLPQFPQKLAGGEMYRHGLCSRRLTSRRLRFATFIQTPLPDAPQFVAPPSVPELEIKRPPAASFPFRYGSVTAFHVRASQMSRTVFSVTPYCWASLRHTLEPECWFKFFVR